MFVIICIRFYKTCREDDNIEETPEHINNHYTMEQVKEFRYLGRVELKNDNDDKDIIQNLQKTKSTWGVLHRLLRKESKRNIKVIVGIYQCIIQTRLLYGSETWVISRQLLRNDGDVPSTYR